MEPGLTPVMSKLEILVQMWGETVMAADLNLDGTSVAKLDLDGVFVVGEELLH